MWANNPWGLTVLLAAWLAGSRTAVQAQELVEGCITPLCHSDIKSRAVVHEPMEDDCETCHEAQGGKRKHPGSQGNEFRLMDSVPDLCYMCHDARNEKSNVHEPVADGDCLSCHSPHSADQPGLIVAEAGEGICETCHDLAMAASTVKHGPAASKFCTHCHEPHESENFALLKKPTPELCLECHTEVQKDAERENVHAAFAEDCAGCHQPHGSNQPALLIAAEPELCFGCHSDVEEAVNEGQWVHQPLVRNRSCLQCHFPHASDFSSLLKAEPPDMCFDCHKTEKSKKRIKPRLDNRLFAHPPALDGDCTVCHSPHGSNYVAMLILSFPAGGYATPGQPQSFEACFQCHESELIEVKSTEVATNFRDGTRNLHYVHVSKRKGRSCNLCHEMHASDNPYLIADKVRFGGWLMPLNFRRHENGGSCLPGCHQELTYSRKR